MKSFNFIISGEFFFAAFLLAGYFKQGIETPIDITLIFLALSMFVSFIRFLKELYFVKNSIKATLLFLVLTLVIVMSYFYTEGVFYAKDKLLRFILITSWSFYGVFYLLKTKESLRKFFYSIGLISFVISIIAILQLFKTITTGTYNGTIFILNTDYLALGRSVGLGLVTLIGFRWFSEQKSKLSNLIIFTMFIVIVFGGGKMPLIAAVLALLFITLMSIKVKRTALNKKIVINKGSKKLLIIFLFFTLSLIPLYSLGLTDQVFRRLILLFSGSDESSLARVYLFSIALYMFKNNILTGAGWGTFSLYYNYMDEKIYPHNIFMELGAEVGVLGLVAFGVLLIYSIKCGFVTYKKVHKKYTEYQYTILVSFVFFFLNANTSGDITDNKILFTYLALMCISPYIKSNEEIESNSHKNKPYKAIA